MQPHRPLLKYKQQTQHRNTHGGGSDRGDDARLGAPPERLLQQPGELGVPVGHVRVVLHEGGDDPAEREQALVDVPGLASARVLGPRASDTLRSVDKQYTKKTKKKFQRIEPNVILKRDEKCGCVDSSGRVATSAWYSRGDAHVA